MRPNLIYDTGSTWCESELVLRGWLIERGIFIIVISTFLLGVRESELVLRGWLIERGIFIRIIARF